MKVVLLLVVLATSGAVGCSVQPTTPPPMEITTPTIVGATNSSVPASLTPGLATLPAFSTATPFASPSPTKLNPTSTPTTTRVPQVPTTQPQATSSSSVTVKTFTSTELGIALDYPGNWSATETANGAKFTSPQGTPIDLVLIDNQNQTPEDFLADTQLPNTHCLNSVNPHGVKVRNCLDTIAFSYSAYFILKPSNNSAHLVSLNMRSKAPDPVYESIIASARLFP